MATITAPTPNVNSEIGAVIRGVTTRRCDRCGRTIPPFERFLFFPIHRARACGRCAGATRKEMAA